MSESVVVSRFGVGYEGSITPCFLKRERRGSKLDGDGEFRSQRPESLLPGPPRPPQKKPATLLEIRMGQLLCGCPC